MSETSQPQDPNQSFDADDLAAQAGAPASATEGAPASSPAQPPATEVVAPGSDTAGGVVAAPVAPSGTPGKPLGGEAPALDSLQNQLCPNCAVGVLYVTRYDPNALHEAGQAIPNYVSAPALVPGHESGGAYEVRCFNCEWSHSFPLNPGDRHGQVR